MWATDDGALLTERFGQDPPHMRATAYRMLGSLAVGYRGFPGSTPERGRRQPVAGRL